MFNLNNLSKENIIPWLKELEQQLENKLSVLNRKIDAKDLDEIKKSVEDLQEELSAIPQFVMNNVYPIGSTIMVPDNKWSKTDIESKFGGTWENAYFFEVANSVGVEGYIIEIYQRTK